MPSRNIVTPTFDGMVPEHTLCPAILVLLSSNEHGKEANCECGRRLMLSTMPEVYVNVVAVGRTSKECPAVAFLKRSR